MSVSCECCVLSGRGLCGGLITRPEESYRLWCVFECDLETSRMRRPWPTGGLLHQKKKNWSFTFMPANKIVCAFRPLIFLCPFESFILFGEEWATKYGSLIACHILYLITFFLLRCKFNQV